jgi:hypothetical protein
MTPFDKTVLILAICGVVVSAVYWITKKMRQGR